MEEEKCNCPMHRLARGDEILPRPWPECIRPQAFPTYSNKDFYLGPRITKRRGNYEPRAKKCVKPISLNEFLGMFKKHRREETNEPEEIRMKSARITKEVTGFGDKVGAPSRIEFRNGCVVDNIVCVLTDEIGQERVHINVEAAIRHTTKILSDCILGTSANHHK